MTVVGEKWAPAAPVGALILIAEAIRVPTWFDRSLMYALGRPGLELRLSAMDAVLLISAVLIGSRWGLIGVGVGLIARSLTMWVVRGITSCKVAKLPARRLILREIRIWTAAVPAGIAALLTRQLTGDWPDVGQLLVGFAAGGAVYLAMSALLCRPDLRYALVTMARLRQTISA